MNAIDSIYRVDPKNPTAKSLATDGRDSREIDRRLRAARAYGDQRRPLTSVPSFVTLFVWPQHARASG
jgi:hypothetical protein